MNAKAIILDAGTLPQLQALLNDGWIVAHTCPMPSSGSGMPTCFVLLARP